MLISEICIKRPVFATVLSLVIVTLGIIFFSKLQLRALPDIDPPIITVNARYLGADALYMEKEITTRIEKALKNVKNLDYMTSHSSDGSSDITLSFKITSDIEIALNDVRSKISEISNVFPQDMVLPSVSKMDSDNFPTLWLVISSDRYDDMELTRIIEHDVRDLLEKLPNVGQANIYGGKYYTMRVEPSPIKMYQHKISPFEIENALKNQNQDYPAGIIKTKARNFSLRLKGSLATEQEIGNIIISNSSNNILKLRDVAKVYLAPSEDYATLRYNGNKSIAVGLIKQSKSNLIDLSNEVRKEIVNIKSILPNNVKLDVAYDGAVSVNASIKAVFRTIIEALILVICVIYLFLGSFKTTIIPLVTIPISLIGAFIAMYQLGFSINTFTLLAMILAIGLVVDDAIVMLENIYRYRKMGKSAPEAALLGSKEIGFAVIAMTITLASVFLPIGFIEGFMGKLFIEFAWTLAICVLFSGFVALTLTPMMASQMLKSEHEKSSGITVKFNQGFHEILDYYIYYLNLFMNNRWKFLLASSGSVVILIFSLIFVEKTFVPAEDSGTLHVAYTGSTGSTADQAEQTIIATESILAKHKDIYGYLNVIWGANGDSAFAFIPLKDWSLRSKSQSQIQNELNQELSKIPGMSIFVMSPRSMEGGGNSRNAIEFNIQSSLEYDQLDKLSKDIVHELEEQKMFVNIERDLKSSTPTLDIIVNRDKAYLYGSDLNTIGKTIEYLVSGRRIGDFRMGNDIYDIVMQYNLQNRNSTNSVQDIFVKSANSMLPLGTFARVNEKITIKSYSHYNSARAVTFTADLAPSYKITDAIKSIDNLTERLIDRKNTKVEYLGEIKRMNESNSNIAITFGLALIFIYLVLSAQFESFTDPLLILLAVPFSITGGVLILLITKNSINMYSNIGLVTLIGLITKNSIMLIEFANQLRSQGCNVKEAIVKSASLRLRPILMTTFATIFGAVPLVLATGAGAASRNSIGLVIIGGMSIGTLFTIFVIPVLYQYFKKD